MRIVITLRRDDSGENSFAAPEDLQRYQIGIAIEGEQLRTHEATLDWVVMKANLAELGATEGAPALEQQIGAVLRRLLASADWSQHEARIREALAAGQQIAITVVANTEEPYRLPWELLTLGDEGTSVQASEKVVIGYAWPTDTPTDEGQRRLARTRPTRVLFAWSAAGGRVPSHRHRECLHSAFGPDGVHEVEDVSLGRLIKALRGMEGDALALHILCHGVADDGGHSLLWDADVVGKTATVSARALRDALAPYAGKLVLVALSVCRGAGAGELGRPLGPVALALHRLGVPWVIGSRYPLSTRGSITFAEAFYAALWADNGGIERAFARARQMLVLDTERRDWLGLQLFARNEYRGRKASPLAGTTRRESDITLHDTSACTPQVAADWCRQQTERVSRELVDTGIYQPAMYVERCSLDDVVSRVSGNEPTVTILIGQSGVGKTSWLATVATRPPLYGRAVLIEGRLVSHCKDLIEAVDEELDHSGGVMEANARDLARALGPGQAVFMLDALDQLKADSPAERSAWFDLSLRRAHSLAAHVIVSCRADSWGRMNRRKNTRGRMNRRKNTRVLEFFLDDFSLAEILAAADKQEIQPRHPLVAAMAHPLYFRLYAEMGADSVSPIELSEQYIDSLCQDVAAQLHDQRSEDVRIAMRALADELRQTGSLEVSYERCRALVPSSTLLHALMAGSVLLKANASDSLRFRFDEIAEVLIAERLDANRVDVDAVADPALEPTIGPWVKFLWRSHLNSERHGDRDALLDALLRRLGASRHDAGAYADVQSLLPFFTETEVPELAQRIDFAAHCLRICSNRWRSLPGDLLERLRIPADRRPELMQGVMEALDPYPWEQKRWYRDPTSFAFDPSERGLFVDVLDHEVPRDTARWIDTFERWLAQSKPHSRARNVAAGCLFHFRYLDRARVMDAAADKYDFMLILLAEFEAEETRAVFRDWIAKDHRTRTVGETVLHRVDYDSMENDITLWVELVRPLVEHADVVSRGCAAAVLLHDPGSREAAIPEVVNAMNEPMSPVTARHLWPALGTHNEVVVDRVKGFESWHLADLVCGWSQFRHSAPDASGSELLALMRSLLGKDPDLDHSIAAALERWLLTVRPIPHETLAEMEALGLLLIEATPLRSISPLVYATGRPVDIEGSDTVRAAWAAALFAKPDISDVAAILIKMLARANWRLRGGAMYVDRLIEAVGESDFAHVCYLELLPGGDTARRVREWFESEPPFEPTGELARELAAS